MPASERRASPRYRFNIAVAIDSGSRTGRVGISHDASTTGLLFNTRSRFVPGDELTLTLHLTHTGRDAKRVRAKVVRTHTVEAQSSYPWRYLTAVRFEEPIPEIESSAKEQAAHPV